MKGEKDKKKKYKDCKGFFFSLSLVKNAINNIKWRVVYHNPGVEQFLSLLD